MSGEMTDRAREDEDLVRRINRGDQEAFLILYRNCHPGIYRFAVHMSGSAAVAEDVTQEVFLSLMRDASRYDASRGPVSAYLYGIARKQVWKALERERPEIPDVRPAAASDDPLADLSRSEMIQSVRQAVLSLPPHYREVVVLCELQEMEYTEAAALLGCPVGTVRSRLHRARGLLQEKLPQFRAAGCLT
jgi:RNA polymerase sigma-70 factor (ECF subfamily)